MKRITKRLLLRSVLLCVLPLLAASACNNVPVQAISGNLNIQNEVTDERPQRPKIDILFVIDNSTSMCEEQLNLTKNFNDFIAQFAITIDADFQLAVITTHASDPQDGGVFRKKQGVYESCERKFTYSCTADQSGNDACRSEFELTRHLGPNWECQVPGGVQTFPNGSVNSSCIKRCTTTQECVDAFDANHLCKGGGGQFSFCQLKEDTTGCDSFTLQSGIMTNSTPNLETVFRCVATVGTIQGSVSPENSAQIEQGLKAAMLALDVNGTRSEQAKAFLRSDAFLAIVFVSDEDDCSHKPGVIYGFEDFAKCALKTETLVPVGDYVAFFKGLKPDDPGKVIVATIAGDAKIAGLNLSPSDPGFNIHPDVVKERQEYLSSKATTGQEGTYICNSDNGRSDYGRRYREMVDKFGSNGVFANICEGDFKPALDLIARKIIDNISASCLNRPVAFGGLRLPGEACQKAEDCLYKQCVNDQCAPLGDVGDACQSAADCYSNQCTGNVCVCNSCPNKYNPYKPFIQVTKILADKTVVTLSGSDYEIKELTKCIEDTNPLGLAVVPSSPPEAGSTIKILYVSKQLSSN